MSVCIAHFDKWLSGNNLATYLHEAYQFVQRFSSCMFVYDDNDD